MKNKKIVKGNFSGTIDQFLNHCFKLDVDAVETQAADEYQQCLLEIKKISGVKTDKQAIEIYNEIALAQVQNTITEMQDQGLVEIVGYDESGEPVYSLTEKGKRHQQDQ